MNRRPAAPTAATVLADAATAAIVNVVSACADACDQVPITLSNKLDAFGVG